ncbi:efflux transporter outer membrane subunit [Magnetospirillum molischianum]|uniref:Putative multidrug efflux system, outer membrane subunit (Efflux pump component) (TolC family) n=1 Tax=Magnetospirillum molischianum DSM 120 TaxID=1150626 RepID=H8FXL6_MAGML|nr:efflux transporter outer membrane subunit [Magnetospirillum molischianum]CCG43104.1 putative multidrug efflux system, outer membrane subunit (efflux pump component) (TolC family) [Magnetospirillum molischianum DSM 120]
MIRTLVYPLTLAALLGGCSIGDAYIAPEAPPPAAWNGTNRTAEWPSLDWWRQFSSPRLDALMQDAMIGNFDIAAAMARVRQAEAQVEIAGGALLPSLTGDGSATRSRSSMATSSSSASASRGGLKPNYVTTYGATVSASYEIDFWGKNRAGVDSAEAAAQASRFDHQTAMLTMQSSIATTYFDILGYSERLRLARESVGNAESVLAVYRDRLAAGTATSLDVAQQENVVASQRATVPPLEKQIRQSRNALAILVGRLPEDLALEPETLSVLAVPEVSPGLPSELLGRRPDVLSAEANLRGANADITVARAAWFPSISLTGQGGFQSVDLAKMMTHQSLLFSLGPSLTVPLFDGGKIAGTVEQKRARWDELVQTYRKAVVSAFSDVEDSLVAVEKTAEAEEEQRVAEATARRAFEIAQSLMSAGTVDVTTVLNTQKTLFSSQDQLAQARLARFQAVVGLYKAMGGGWSSDKAAP